MTPEQYVGVVLVFVIGVLWERYAKDVFLKEWWISLAVAALLAPLALALISGGIRL